MLKFADKPVLCLFVGTGHNTITIMTSRFLKTILLATGLLAFALSASARQHAGAQAQRPVWLESDSAAAIHSRLLSDFSLTPQQAVDQINSRYGLAINVDTLRHYARNHWVEMKTIDGRELVHRKSPRNLALLHPAMNGGTPPRGATASAPRIAYVDSVLALYDNGTGTGAGHHIVYRFTIDVPYTPALRGDTLRVWMPMPLETQRQRNVKVLSALPGPAQCTPAEAQALHNTLYMSAPVVTGKPTHFEATISYDALGEYFSPEFIAARIKPYDRTSQLYREYTAEQLPHIVYKGDNAGIADLARSIVGEETDPYRQSELVYDYIINRYPWAGAREYSTLECIPRYVLREGHGDCGQVALLYISLMRSLGVPARWESGWMLHPGEKNLHDWAEVYFEGVGWVPVDVSFGRYTGASDPRARKFYSTGMDAWRMASNKGVSGAFSPAKKFVRSETVDAQLGEVESTRGNLFYPGWQQNFEILEATPLARNLGAEAMADTRRILADVRSEMAPDKRQVVYEIEAAYGPDSTITVSGNTSEAGVKTELMRRLSDEGVRVNDRINVYPDTLWALPRISVAFMRVAPGHDKEMATQSLMGMPLRLLEKRGDWWRAQTPDGYISWVVDNSLAPKTVAEMDAWRAAPRLVVTAPYQVRAYTTPTAKGVRDVVTDLVNGDIVEGSLTPKKNGRVQITLPDGRKGWVDAADVTDINTWAAQNFDAEKILDLAYSMEGSPYFWGGTSVKNLDCSGLAKVSYLSNGIILMRDASQQALTGKRIEASDWRTCRPGDLLFFGNAKTGRVTHVAIHDHDGDYVHSSGRVKRNSVDPSSPAYLTTPFLHAVRIDGAIGTPGITYAREHPWYFNIK